MTLADLRAGTKFPDVVGVGGASNGEHGPWQIPYGALVPTKIDNIWQPAAASMPRCGWRSRAAHPQLPCDRTSAGVAAAVASLDNCPPRKADIGKIQKILKNKRPTWVESTAAPYCRIAN